MNILSIRNESRYVFLIEIFYSEYRISQWGFNVTKNIIILSFYKFGTTIHNLLFQKSFIEIYPRYKFFWCVAILCNQNWCESVWFQPKLRCWESKIEGSGFESRRPLVVKLFLSNWGDILAWFHWLPAHRASPGMFSACWKIIDSKKVWFKYTPKIHTKNGYTLKLANTPKLDDTPKKILFGIVKF